LGGDDVEFISLLSCVLILIGAGFMLFSILKSIEIRRDVPLSLDNKWKIAIILMSFFLFGYVFFVIIVTLNIKIPDRLIAGAVFLGGAIFVHTIVSLSSTTINAMNMKEELEEKVKERTVEIENLLTQKNAFICQLGHDLKNPIGPILTLLPELKEDLKDPKLLEIIDVLDRNVNHMKNLVTKTIKLGRLNSPNVQLNLEDINLESQVNEIIQRNRLLFNEKNIEIDNNIPGDFIIKADKLQLTELFDNLTSNSVKYSPDGGKITIDVKKDENIVNVSIHDDGAGMTEEQLGHLFEEFYKADKSRHDFDSSGLGMPIAKRIVEKHGGKIWAESPGLGKGTTIFFTIPYVEKNEEQVK